MSVIHLEDVKSILSDFRKEEWGKYLELAERKKDKTKFSKAMDKSIQGTHALDMTILYLNDKIKERNKLYKTQIK